MLIQELTRQASLDLLARTHLGRLACTQGARPYVVPVYFAYHNGYLYSFSTVGQKIEWMRANPLVCVEADEVAMLMQLAPAARGAPPPRTRKEISHGTGNQEE